MNKSSCRPALITAVALGCCVTLGSLPVDLESAEQTAPRQPDTFGFGRPATAIDIERLNIDVTPDGTGLPLGSGTARSGVRTWGRVCRGCHGPEGEGGTAAPVVGLDPNSGPPTVGNFWPYATTLYDYINRAMPRNAPGTLSPDEVYSLVAWILAKNEIIAEDTIMSATTLPGVVMPARNRFVPDDRRGGSEVR